MNLPVEYKMQGDNKGGFTLIELLIVISILVLLLSSSATLFHNFFVSTQQKNATAQVIHLLRQARAYATSGKGLDAHGVYIATSTITLYQGTSYTARNQMYDVITPIEPAIVIVSSFVNNDIQFAAGTGFPQATGTIAIHHIANGTSTIIVNMFGIVDE